MGHLDIGSIFKPESDVRGTYDCVIIGGGPGGITAGIYDARGGLATIVLGEGVDAVSSTHLTLPTI